MAKKKPAEVEWVGGVFSMPAYVSGDGEPYRPDALLWLNLEAEVLGSTVAEQGELLALACESLKNTIAQPIFGPPHAPARLRVASEELARALRAGHPGVEVVCAPTPEVDAVASVMREQMRDQPEPEESYLSPECGPEAVGSFFRSAALLFRTKPWERVPVDQRPFSVTIEKLNVREAALSIIEQKDERFGFVLCSGVEDFEAFLDGAEDREEGEEPKVPPHFTLSFDRDAEIGPALRKEIAEHRWELANADAYPWFAAVDEDLVARPPTARELTIAEAISLALAQVLAEQPLQSEGKIGVTVWRTVKVSTHAGDVEVALRSPYGLEARQGEELGQLDDQLLGRFESSPEATSLPGMGAVELVMDYAADYFGAKISKLEANELREIIFDIIPRKASIKASHARGIIEELRAFYRFLKREHGLEQADACLRVLEGDAVTRLDTALSNPGNFGMAKSLMMAGYDAGFDMSTQQGIDAWLRQSQGKAPPSRPVSTAAARAKKKQRKTARKARKRNR